MHTPDPMAHDSDNSSESDWTLQDYHAILDLGGSSDHQATERPDTIPDTKVQIKLLNLNLYDLLDWFRNPDTSHRPERFSTVEELGKYSYANNKVFPRYKAEQSRVANPLLRRIGSYEKLRPHRGGGRRGGRPRGELGRRFGASGVNQAAKSTANRTEVTSAAAETGQENGAPRRKWGHGRKSTTQNSESHPASFPEAPGSLAVEVTA